MFITKQHVSAKCTCIRNSGRSKNFEKEGGTEDNLSAPSSFIANSHNEIYSLYMEKRLFGKNMRQCPPPPNPPLVRNNTNRHNFTTITMTVSERWLTVNAKPCRCLNIRRGRAVRGGTCSGGKCPHLKTTLVTFSTGRLHLRSAFTLTLTCFVLVNL